MHTVSNLSANSCTAAIMPCAWGILVDGLLICPGYIPRNLSANFLHKLYKSQKGANQFLCLTLLIYHFTENACENCKGDLQTLKSAKSLFCIWFPPCLFIQRNKMRGVPSLKYVGKTPHLEKLQGSAPLKFLQVCQFCNMDIVSSTLTITPLCE